MSIGSIIAVSAVLVALPGASFAQPARPLTANAKLQFGALTGFVIRSAEKVPEDLYAFRATPEVRSMGELFGHVADALFAMCSTAAGPSHRKAGLKRRSPQSRR